MLDRYSILDSLTVFNTESKMASPKDTKGPVVKSDPTKGQNRSRNADGQWRKKRNNHWDEDRTTGKAIES